MSKEELRAGFEAWHCEQYKTKRMTGAPTRDMHNGVRAEDYGSKKQQALWECWQETGGDMAKVEALKVEIELVEAGKQPIAWFRSDALGCAMWKPGATQALKDGDPLYTRADAGDANDEPGEALTLHYDAMDACAEIEREGVPGDVIREMNDELVDLRAQLAERDSLLRETSDYLDGSTRNAVWCDSILHKKMKAALSESSEVKS